MIRAIEPSARTIKSNNKTSFKARPFSSGIVGHQIVVTRKKPTTSNRMALNRGYIAETYLLPAMRHLRENNGKVIVPHFTDTSHNCGTLEIVEPSRLKKFFRKLLGDDKTVDLLLKTEVVENNKVVPNKKEHLKISITQDEVCRGWYRATRADQTIVTELPNKTLIEKQNMVKDDLNRASIWLDFAFEGIAEKLNPRKYSYKCKHCSCN